MSLARPGRARRTPIPAPRALALVALLLAPACSFSPRETGGAFQSASVMDNGRTVLFTATWGEWHREGGAFLEGPGARVFDRDRVYVGSHDLESGATRLLHAEDAEPGALGQSGYRLRSTRGTRALLSRHVGPNARSNERAGWYLLDVARGSFERLPLERWLGGRGAGAVSFALLVSDAGDLLVGTKHGTSNERATLWLRRPSGELQSIARDATYHGVKQGELLIWTPEARLVAWSLASGASRSVLSKELAGVDRYREHEPQPAVMAREARGGGESFLELYPDRKGSSGSRALALRVAELE